MSKETVVVEVEPESIKPQPVDVKVSSPVSNEEMPDIISVNNECSDQKVVKESLVWDVNTISSNEVDGRHLRRHSASLLFGPNRKVGVPSRYRGGSVGSCHDMCKFGHKNTSEVVKPKSYVKKTPLSSNQSDGTSLKKVASSADSTKRSVVRRLSFADAKVGMSVPKEKATTAESPETVKEQGESCLVGDEEKPIVLVSATLRTKAPVKKAASMNNRIQRDRSSSSHLKNHLTIHKQEAKAKLHEDVPEKTLYMIEPSGKSTPAETSQKAPLPGKRLQKTQGESYVGTRKGSKATQNGSEESRFCKSFVPWSNKSFKVKSEKREDTESVVKHSDAFYGYRKSKSSTQEAISRTPKLKPGARKVKQNGRQDSHLIKSLLPAMDEPSPSQEEEELAGTESVLGKQGDTMSRDTKTKPRTPKAKPGTPKVKQDGETKTKAIIKGAKGQNGEGEGLDSAWKMKFRRGKVISLPSGNNSPVKLKFRRPTSFSDSRLAENAGNVNYKNKQVDGEDPLKDGSEPVKVVLRRHEATQKKDDVDLNNVIEETASKLVKTRKSKVKALVGAFETVMYLRDRNPSEATSTS